MEETNCQRRKIEICSRTQKTDEQNPTVQEPEAIPVFYTSTKQINERDKTVSVTYDVEDVRCVIRDKHIKTIKELTDDDCFEVLKHCRNNHDMEYGITWDTLAYWVRELFGAQCEKF